MTTTANDAVRDSLTNTDRAGHNTRHVCRSKLGRGKVKVAGNMGAAYNARVAPMICADTRVHLDPVGGYIRPQTYAVDAEVYKSLKTFVRLADEVKRGALYLTHSRYGGLTLCTPRKAEFTIVARRDGTFDVRKIMADKTTALVVLGRD